MTRLKNLPTDNPELMASLITAKKNRVISMALASGEDTKILMLTFPDNEKVSEEEYLGDVMYFMVEGNTEIRINNVKKDFNQGEVIMVPAHTLHAVGGKNAFKILQIIVKEGAQNGTAY